MKTVILFVVSPLCYLYDDPVELYIVFRTLYTKYFYKLHNISPDEEVWRTISYINAFILPGHHFSVYNLWENPARKRAPAIPEADVNWSVAVSTSWHPSEVVFLRLQLAFRWLLRAFSGYLAAEQVLLLWDRVIAWDSLEIMAGELATYRHYCFHTFW